MGDVEDFIIERFPDETDDEYVERSKDLDRISVKYRGVRVMYDDYSPVGAIRVIIVDNRIDFNVPCICGIYKDEPHNHIMR
jgi:hypothetical protein